MRNKPFKIEDQAQFDKIVAAGEGFILNGRIIHISDCHMARRGLTNYIATKWASADRKLLEQKAIEIHTGHNEPFKMCGFCKRTAD